MAAYTMLLGASPGISRVVYSAGYNTSTVTTTSATPSNLQAFDITEKSATDYTIFWLSGFQHSVLTSDYKTNLSKGGSSVVDYNMELKDLTDIGSGSGTFYYNGTGATANVALQHSVEVASTTTGSSVAKNLIALEHISTDRGAHDATGNTAFTTSYNSTPNATVGSAGDYLIVSSAACDASLGYGLFETRINASATGSGHSPVNNDTTNYSPYLYTGVHTLTSGANIYISGTTSASTAVGMKQASVGAFPLTGFRNAYYKNQTGNTAITSVSATTTATTYQVVTTATFNILNPSNKHLLIASAAYTTTNTTYSAYARLTNGSTTLYSPEFITEGYGGTKQAFVARVLTFAGSTQTFQWEYRSENVAATSYISDADITLLDLGTETIIGTE